MKVRFSISTHVLLSTLVSDSCVCMCAHVCVCARTCVGRVHVGPTKRREHGGHVREHGRESRRTVGAGVAAGRGAAAWWGVSAVLVCGRGRRVGGQSVLLSRRPVVVGVHVLIQVISPEILTAFREGVRLFKLDAELTVHHVLGDFVSQPAILGQPGPHE